MRFVPVAFVWLVICVANLQALTVVEDTHMSWAPTPPRPPGSSTLESDYSATINQEILPSSGDAFYHTFGLFKFSADSDFLLEGSWFSLDERLVWYLTEAGDVFTEKAIREGQFEPVMAFLGPPPFTISSVIVGEEFYLGVATTENLTDVPFTHLTIFGWMHLKVLDNHTIVMLDNAVSYESKGIVIGTSIAIPEPGSMVLALLVLIPLVGRQARAI